MGKIQRFGKVIEVKEEKLKEYLALHDDRNPGVRHLLSKYHMHNYSINLHRFDDGKYYLFSYFEYSGDDYEGDMSLLADEPENQEWWKLTDPCQVPLKNRKLGEHWSTMTEVYYNK